MMLQRGLRTLAAGVMVVGVYLVSAQPQKKKESAMQPYHVGTFLQPVRKFYTIADGLPSNNVRALALDAQGRVYAATDKGVAVFDGKQWETESQEKVNLFFTDRSRTLWAATEMGVLRRSEGNWQREENAPGGIVAMSEDDKGRLFAVTAQRLYVRHKNGWAEIRNTQGTPRGICAYGDGELLVTTDMSLQGLWGKRPTWLSIQPSADGLLSADTRAIVRLRSDANHFLITTDKGINLYDGNKGWHRITGAEGLPILDVTHAAISPPTPPLDEGRKGGVSWWFGTPVGVCYYRDGEWKYFAGQRWLPDDKVQALAAADDGSAWVATAKGISHIYWRPITLLEKAQIFHEAIEKRHKYFGYVTTCGLRQPGDLSQPFRHVSDNDGLWTAMYIAAECFRYAVTKDPAAKEAAKQSMDALLRLESITGISGFPARAIRHKDEPGFGQDTSGEWHRTPDGEWEWKGETSSDEIDGHFFAFGVYYDLMDDEAEKAKVRATCQRIMDHIMKNGYYLVDVDGKPTTWGVWAPEQLNDNPRWWQERGLNSLELLSYLKVTHHLTGDEKYHHAYVELIQKHGYALNTINQKITFPGEVNHSDDELAFLAYYSLMRRETDPHLRAIYTQSITRSWRIEQPERCPLWNFIYGALTGKPCDIEGAVRTLKEIPLDLVMWSVRNSHRADLQWDEVAGRFGERQVRDPLPFDERPMMKWNGNPYRVDGGSTGTAEEDPTMFLLPYWLGRYHGLIE
ncbi:MAG: hypothetical protein NZT92_01735 [Abditibacteriales bacterium]|nr:hypothetical protein [Abditibacteriales bacterium]MDW8364443.1 two-component regulator propeller domain-containing protein [Abditibacteriales bacterium]